MKIRLRKVLALPWLDGLFQDFRYAARSLLRSPGFTLTAVATLAVGIGIDAAVFTVTNATLFKGYSLVKRNDRLVYVTTGNPGCCVSYPDFEDWRSQAKSFEDVALVRGMEKTLLARGGAPENYLATEVTANTFRLLGVKPILGRDFAPSDAQAGAAPTVILRYDFWERRFGKDPSIIGRTVQLNGVATTVIGVMPPGFSFPQDQNLWTPLVPTAELQKRGARDTWFALGRLADGVTIEQARAEMQTIGRRLGTVYPLTNQGRYLRPYVQTFEDQIFGASAVRRYKELWAAVSFVLLIACANVANLLLSRAVVRSREISIRAALGSGRWRMVRQLLVESVLLSSLGAVLGWWIAKVGVHLYVAAHASQASYLDFAMDYRVFAYVAALSAGTGLLFGMAPALRLSKLDVNSTLKDGGRSATGGARGKRLSSLLVIGEMALAVVLLAAAGVMLRSFFNVYTADIGVDTANVLTISTNLPHDRYPTHEKQVAFYTNLKMHLTAIPGVQSVAFANETPTGAAKRVPYELANERAVNERDRPTVARVVASRDYFRTLGASVLSGRGFSDFDRASSRPVVIVNQKFASRHWRGQNPLGQRLRLFDGKKPGAWLTVVGVVSNIVQNDSTRQDFDPLIYLPYRQDPKAGMWALGAMSIFVRTRVAPGSFAATVRHAVQALDPALPINLGTLAERLHRANSLEGISVLFLIFAAVALLLASVGLYAVIAHSVSQRTQEIGIRAAMGATARDIRSLVLRQGGLPLGAGLGIGLVASFAANHLLESQLVGVSPADPVTLVGASGVLIAAAVLGCLIPARRAMHVDPVIALRHE